MAVFIQIIETVRKTKLSFKCVVCGHTDNADVNASKNIAIPDIENIIKEFFKK